MSTAFQHMPEDIVAKLLLDRGLATDALWWKEGSRTAADDPTGAHDWPNFAGTEPDKPDNCLTVYWTDDRPDVRILVTGEDVMHKGIQIKVRGATKNSGGLKLLALHHDLTERATDQVVTMASPTARYLVQSFPVVRMTKAYRAAPGSDRYAYSLNCLAVILPYPIQG